MDCRRSPCAGNHAVADWGDLMAVKLSKKKRKNPNRIPVVMTKADFDKAIIEAIKIATVDAYTILFTVLHDKEGYELRDIQRVYDETGRLTDAINEKRITLADLRCVLKEECDVELERKVGVI